MKCRKSVLPLPKKEMGREREKKEKKEKKGREKEKRGKIPLILCSRSLCTHLKKTGSKPGMTHLAPRAAVTQSPIRAEQEKIKAQFKLLALTFLALGTAETMEEREARQMQWISLWSHSSNPAVLWAVTASQGSTDCKGQ